MSTYNTTQEKAIIAVIFASIGSGITTALAFQIPNSASFITLTIVAAVLTPIATYLGVFFKTNKVLGENTTMTTPTQPTNDSPVTADTIPGEIKTTADNKTVVEAPQIANGI